MSNGDSADVVQFKDYIILKRSNNLLLHQLTKKPRVQCSGCNIDLSNIIGKSYSSTYRMELIQKNSYSLETCNLDEIPSCFALNNTESGIDNRNIQDDNNAQALSKEKIISLKNKGISSQDIVQQLIDNSKTFTHKTEFAQEKWLRKKSRKYTDYVQILKPNIRLLSEVLMCNTANPNNVKLLSLRMDTLSQIITLVNFQPQGKYIVYENSCEGLIIAALLNLIDVKGKLLNVTIPNYSFSKRKALLAMKFSEAKHKSVINIKLSTLAKYSNCGNSVRDSLVSVDPTLLNNLESQILSSTLSNGDQYNENLTVPNEDQVLKRKAENENSESKRTNYQERENEEVRQLMIEKADGLIVVCKEKPNDFVKEMLQFVGPSRSFVIFNQSLVPLTQLYEDLKQRKDVINIRLVENWLRSYQVLTDRTHPEITMLGTGGYLLTGITVTNNSE